MLGAVKVVPSFRSPLVTLCLRSRLESSGCADIHNLSLVHSLKLFLHGLFIYVIALLRFTVVAEPCGWPVPELESLGHSGQHGSKALGS